MKKFSYAFKGLVDALKEKSVLVQVILGVLAIIGGIIIKLDEYEWLAFIICIFSVIAFEILNSVVEKLATFVSPEYNDKIKVIKDMAAAAVLVASLGSLVVCLVVVIRRLTNG